MQPFTAGRRAWDPFADLQRMQREMNRLFADLETDRGARGSPPVNLWVGENTIVVTAEAPGVPEDKLEISAHDQTLTIAGERPEDLPQDGAAWRRRERVTGSFSRTIELPFRVDPDTVSARLTDGVVQVELHRPVVDQPRRITVNAG